MNSTLADVDCGHHSVSQITARHQTEAHAFAQRGLSTDPTTEQPAV
jgi:hypothetical protein